jgi:hypothetical protein
VARALAASCQRWWPPNSLGLPYHTLPPWSFATLHPGGVAARFEQHGSSSSLSGQAAVSPPGAALPDLAPGGDFFWSGQVSRRATIAAVRRMVMPTEVCSPLNKQKRPAPPLDVHAALRRTNPKTAQPQEQSGPKGYAGVASRRGYPWFWLPNQFGAQQIMPPVNRKPPLTRVRSRGGNRAAPMHYCGTAHA